MFILKVVALLLAILYGGSSMLGGIIQLKQKKIPLWSSLCLCFLGFMISCSACLIFIVPTMLLYLTVSLVLLHGLAIANGFHMYGKIHASHHLLRLVVSVLVVLFFGL